MGVSHSMQVVRRRGRRVVTAAAVAAAVAQGVLSPAVLAQVATWDNTAGNWSDANHWSSAAIPTSNAATVVQFGSGAADYVSTFDLPTAFQLNQLTAAVDVNRTNAVTAPTLTNTLDFVASGSTQPRIDVSGGGTFRVGNNIRVAAGANLGLNVASGSYLVFSGAATPNVTGQSISPVTGTTSTVTVDGGGTVVWRSISTNNIVVNNATVLTDADGDFLGNANVTLGTGAVVDGGGFGEGWNSLAGVAGATIKVNVGVGAATGNFRYDGVVANRAAGTNVNVPGYGSVGGTAASNTSLTKSGGHTFTVSGANTYSGNTTITEGTLVYAGDAVAATTTKGFPSGAVTSSPFGTGTTVLNGGTLTIEGTNRTIANAVTSNASTTSTINVPDGAELTTTGLFTHNGIVNKTGTGTWRHGGTGAANLASVLNINAGTVLLNDVTGGDLNTATVNVNNGGTFVFGSSPALGGSENPDHPATTFFNLNTGGTITWNIGEDLGGVHMRGGSLNMRGNINLTGTSGVEFETGTITSLAGTPAIGGTQTITKIGPGTVTINGVNLNNSGGLTIADGTISTNANIASLSGSTPISAPVTLGAATTAGTLEYTGNSTAAAITRTFTLNAGGGVVRVTDPAAVLTFGGPASGPGALTKDGPGTLVLTGSVSHAGGTTISGGTLSVGNGGAGGSLSGNVVNNGTLAFNKSDALTFAGNVSGTGAVTKLGNGTVNLTGALTYAGATTVSGGTLRVGPATLAGPATVGAFATLAVAGNANAAGTLTVPSLDLDVSGTNLRFELNQTGNPTSPLLNVTTANGLKLNGGTHTIAVSNQKPLSVGAFTLVGYNGTTIADGFQLAPLPARTQGALLFTPGAIKLNVTGSDSVKWNGNLGPDWVAGSDINVGGTMNFKLASNGSATNFVANDAVVFDDTAAGNGTVNLAESLSPASVTVNNAAKAYSFEGSGSITGTASLVKQGAGTLTVLTTNSYTGGTTVSGGTLRIGNGTTGGDIGPGPLVNDGAVVWDTGSDVTFPAAVSGSGSISKPGITNLTFQGPVTGTGPVSLGGGRLIYDAAADYTHAGAISGDGAVTKSNVGTVTLTGNSTYTGGTAIDQGTLQVGNGGTTGSIVGNVTVNGLSGAAGALIFNRSDTVTFAGNIDSSGRIVNAGTGNTRLTGVITQNGINPGAIVAQAGTLTLANPTPGGIVGAVTAGSGATIALDTTTGDQTYNNPFTGQGTIAKVGPGTVTLTGTSSFSGTFRIDAGTVILGDPQPGAGTDGNLNATDVTVNNGGTFQFGLGGVASENPDFPDTSVITAKTGGNIVWRVGEQIGGISLQGGTLTFDGGGTTSNLAAESWQAGTVTTSGATAFNAGGGAVITKTTAGTVLITGAATVNRTMIVQDGTMAYANAANLSGNAITLGVAGGTSGAFEYRGLAASKAGNVTLAGGGIVRVTQPATVLTMSGVFGGAGSLAKEGPGVVSLTGNNTFTGGATVSAGTLLVTGQTGNNSGTGTGNVTVAGGTLGGAGSIAGTLSVGGAGSRLSPGGLSADASASVPGILNLAKTVSFGAGGVFDVQLGGAGDVAGVDFDQLVVKGTGVGVTIADGAVLNVLPLAADVALGRSFVVLDQTGGGTLTGTFRDPAGNVLGEGGTLVAGGQQFAVSYANGDVTLYRGAAPVPEPGTAGVLAAAAGLLLTRRRSRRVR